MTDLASSTGSYPPRRGAVSPRRDPPPPGGTGVATVGTLQRWCHDVCNRCTVPPEFVNHAFRGELAVSFVFAAVQDRLCKVWVAA